jgi:hypothetical protein
MMNAPVATLVLLASVGITPPLPDRSALDSTNNLQNQFNHQLRVAQTSASTNLPKFAQGKLQALGIPIAVPNYLPSGYRFLSVVTEPCRPDSNVNANGVCRFGPSYSIVYINANRSCFVVEATGGGVGGPSAEYVHSFTAPLFQQSVQASISFGRRDKYGGIPKKATAADLSKTYDVVYGEWLGTSPFYRVSSFYPRSVSACNSQNNRYGSLTPLEAQRVTQSLRWLSPR